MPDKDSFERTVATLLFIGVWAIVVVGPMFLPEANRPPAEIQIGITSVVFLILGRMWNLEVERLGRIRISTDGGRERDDDRERNGD